MTSAPAGLLAETAELFVAAHRLLDPVRMEAYEAMGLTLPQIKIMMAVRATPGLNGRALAAQLGITASAVSQHVERLVNRGLLRRMGDAEDRRRVILELTDEGEASLNNLHAAANKLAEAVLATLPPGDLDVLHRVLAELVQANPLA